MISPLPRNGLPAGRLPCLHHIVERADRNSTNRPRKFPAEAAIAKQMGSALAPKSRLTTNRDLTTWSEDNFRVADSPGSEHPSEKAQSRQFCGQLGYSAPQMCLVSYALSPPLVPYAYRPGRTPTSKLQGRGLLHRFPRGTKEYCQRLRSIATRKWY